MSSSESSYADSSVDAAYSKVENMIRSFSREKMGLEEQILSLRQQVALRDKDVDDKNQQLKAMTLEKDRLQAVHDEDDKRRIAVEAMVTYSEHKIALLVETLCSYEDKIHEIKNIHKTYEDYTSGMKKRQLLLHQLLSEEENKNKDLTTKYQFEMNEKAAEIGNLHQRLEQANEAIKSLTDAKQALQNSYVELNNEKASTEAQLKDNLMAATEAGVLATTQLADKTAELQILESRLEQSILDLDTLTAEKVALEKSFEELSNEKARTDVQLNDQLLAARKAGDLARSQLADKAAELEDLQRRLEQANLDLEKLAAEKVALGKSYEELSIEKASTEAKLNDEVLISKDSVKTAAKKLAERESEIENLESQLEELKLEKKSLAKEKEVLEKSFEELSNEKARTDVQLNDQLLAARKAGDLATIQLADKAAELEDLQRRLEQANLDLEKLAAEKVALGKSYEELSIEKANTEAKLNDEVLISKDSVKTAAKKLAERESEIENLESQIEELKLEKKSLAKEKEVLEKSFEELSNEKASTVVQLNDQLLAARKAGDLATIQLADKAAELEDLQRRLEQANLDMEKLAAEKVALGKSYEELSIEKAKTEAKLNDEVLISKDSVKTAAKKLAKRKSEMENLESQIEELKLEKKALAKEKEVLQKSYEELRSEKEDKEASLNGQLIAANKFNEKLKSDVKAKAAELRKNRLDMATDEKKILALSKETEASAAKNKNLASCNEAEAAAPAPKNKPFRPSFSRPYTGVSMGLNGPRGILRSNADSTLDRKRVSFGSPIEQELLSSPDEESDSSGNVDGTTEIDDDFSSLRVCSQNSGQKRANTTPEKPPKSPAEKKMKTSQSSPSVNPDSENTGRKFFRRSLNRSPVVPPTPSTPRRASLPQLKPKN